jgi:hypothetical protein
MERTKKVYHVFKADMLLCDRMVTVEIVTVSSKCLIFNAFSFVPERKTAGSMSMNCGLKCKAAVVAYLNVLPQPLSMVVVHNQGWETLLDLKNTESVSDGLT